MEYINAFWVGGLICALVQILLEKTKMLPGKGYGASGMYRGSVWKCGPV